MLVIRYEVRGQTFVGVRTDDGAVHRAAVASLSELLNGDFRGMVEQAAAGPAETDQVRLLAPVDGRTEVWAAGVTYQRSSEARQEESEVADVYARVYGADRPELFFKSVAWRVAGDGEPIGIRDDSPVDVPEPELAVVVAADGTIVGYTVCDDVSSRTIEGENPLYLPQAKIYAGSCALGPGIRPAWEVPSPYELTISASVRRGPDEVWSASTSTKLLHRRLDDLVSYLFRQYDLPDGAILSTGTGIVPSLDFTLTAGDSVAITVSEVGTLTNPVVDATSLLSTGNRRNTP
ncbi:fumarylacetoacetate hydrolase family protein [Actinoplanes sp. NPDC049265]|uniref:fumarylacetoacetate hydrolase family protein n=1 Tax=Actinoplanes sp. NPDC049265 TaxID=3363902 RepID=UPI0037105AF4